jgi:ankyrin repeat protein
MKEIKWDLKARTSDGRTALILEAENGPSTTVDQLLAKGADPETKDKVGWSIVHCAAYFG